MARAKKRADGRYAVQLTVGHKDGKPVRKTFYSQVSIADARRQRDEWMDMHEYGGEGLPTAKIDGSLTLDAWIEKWLKSYKGNLEANTQEFYASKSSTLADYSIGGVRLGDMSMRSIKPIYITEYIASLSGKSKSTIRSSKTTVQQIFDAAKTNGVIDRDLCADLKDSVTDIRVRGTYTGHKALPKQTVDLICNNYGKHRFGLFVMIMLFSGLRPGEVAALRWDDVDFSKNVLHVREARDLRHDATKGTKTETGVRSVPLFAPLRKALQEHRGIGYIVTDSQGRPYDDASVTSAFRSFKLTIERVINGADAETNVGFRAKCWERRTGKKWKSLDFTLYDLRVTFCTSLYDAGVDIKAAQKMMGHRDSTTTMRIYTKLSEEREEQSTAKMDAFLQQMYGC